MSIELLANINCHQQLYQYCQKLLPLMQLDISGYAKGRYRLWLNVQPNLSQVAVTPAYQNDSLWQAIKIMFPECDTALLTFNGNCDLFSSNGTIAHHRDANFAQPPARMLNLGGISHFSYSLDHRNNRPDNCTTYLLRPGDLVSFDCKHLHACTFAEPGRMSLVMWQMRDTYKV
jgi:hypothetical protein